MSTKDPRWQQQQYSNYSQPSQRGRQMPMSRKDSASSRNIEKASFEYDNIAGGENYRPATGLRRANSVQIEEQDEAEPQSKEQVDGGEEMTDNNAERHAAQERDDNDDANRHTNAYDDEAYDEEPYDLRPPLPTVSHNNMEMLAERFFSVDHLDLLLQDPQVFARFRKFLKEHRPDDLESLQRYMETRKAVMAVEYANAIAHSVSTTAADEDKGQAQIAATVDEDFEAQSRQACAHLIEESLPAYITHRFVGLVTDTLVKEITGNNAPIMKELVPSLAEVYCLSDPSMPDNPIVYASEGFFSYTQYGRDYTFGRNCRFLQGPKTADSSIRRLIDALNNGREIVETILNYRRDGTPFMNLLMVSPLYDNKGRIRYFLGCQVDVSPLVEDGRGLESFADLLKRDRSESSSNNNGGPKEPKELIAQLGAMLNDEELSVIKPSISVANGGFSTPNSRHSSARGQQAPPLSRRGTSRLKFGMSALEDPVDIWPDSDLGYSGRLPGVYQNYMLVRPFPSLRITFTSPALRIPGLMQTKLLDRIGGPQHVREDIYAALEEGTAFTAKITWHTASRGSSQSNHNSNAHSTLGLSARSTNSKNGTSKRASAAAAGEAARADFAERRTLSQETPPHPGPGRGPVGLGHGKTRWIHCTPMLGSDNRVGVWMVVMVEGEEVTGRLNYRNSGQQQQHAQQGQRQQQQQQKRGQQQQHPQQQQKNGPPRRGTLGERARQRRRSERLDEEVEEPEADQSGDQMYADYLRNEGNESRMTTDSARERKEVDDHFRDF